MSNTTKARHVLAALPIVAQALARKAQVEIVLNSSLPTAATDGRRILLPAFPMPTQDVECKALEKLAVLAYGYIDHEVGHVLFTDFGAFKKAKNHHGLLNAIEDPRQEMDMIRTYPGTRRTLDALSILLINDDAQGVHPDMAPTDLVTSTAHAWLRVCLRNEPAYLPISDAGMDLIEQKLGVGVRHRLLALLAGPGMAMRDTNDALSLTRAIMQMLKEEAEKAQQEAQQDGQSDQQDSQGDQGDQQGDQGDQQGSDKQSPAKERAAALEAAANGENAVGFTDRGLAVSEEIREASGEIKKQTHTFEMEKQVVGREESLSAPELGGPLDEAKAERAAAKLRRKMNVLLEARSRVNNRVKDSGQRLSIRHLPNIAVQDARVFAHRGQARRVDTAVMLLGDCSGSMGHGQMEIANGGLFAASKALEALRGVKVAAMTFPGNGLIKGFDQPVLSVLRKFRPKSNGSTPLTEALFSAARMLRSRREPRKIILVLTDGAPNNFYSAQAVLNTLPSLGIEVFGIGIQHQGVTDLFAKSTVVDRLENLPEAIFSLLQKQLAA